MTGRLPLACSAAVALIALALAGMMDTGGGTDCPPASPASHRPRDAAVVGDDTPLFRQGIAAVAPDTWDARIEPVAEWDGPTLLVNARFRVRPAGAAEEGDFTCGHPVSLWADGTLVATSDPPGLRLPAKARDAVFKAVGYRPVALPMPAAIGGSVDFGNIVFEPDAAVRVRLADAPFDGGEVRFVVGKALSVPYAERTATLRDGSAEVQLPAPSGEDLQVCAFTVSDPAHNRYFATECRTIRVRSGEIAVVELRPLPGGRVIVEVRGPSPALSSHLAIQLWDRSKQLDRTYQPPRSALDAHGRAVFCVPEHAWELDVESERGRMLLTACDGSGCVPATADGTLLTMQPIEPLAGILVRNQGQPVSSRLSLRGPDQLPGNTTRTVCHVCTASEAQAAKEFHFQVEEGGHWHTCTAEDAHSEGDLVWLDVERSRTRCRLTVSAELPADYYQALGIRAEPLDGGAAIRIGGNRSPFDGRLPSGAYRLRWTCSGGAGAVIDDRLELAAGEHREINALVPVLDRWDARIRDQEALGNVGPVYFRMGEIWSEGALLPGRTIPFLMPASSRPGSTAEIYLFSHKMTVPGRVTSVDEATHTFVLEHDVTPTDRVRIRTSGLGSGERRICLTSQLTANRIPTWLGDAAEVLVLPGSDRGGCLVEHLGDWQQVTCWFTLRHGSGEVLVEPHGHWTTVRFQSAGVVHIFLDGPVDSGIPVTGPGSIPMAGQVVGPDDCRVFVADGTRAVRVVRPQGTLTFAPDQVEIVVR